MRSREPSEDTVDAVSLSATFDIDLDLDRMTLSDRKKQTTKRTTIAVAMMMILETISLF